MAEDLQRKLTSELDSYKVLQKGSISNLEFEYNFNEPNLKCRISQSRGNETTA